MSRIVRWIHEGGLSSSSDTERQLIVERFVLRPVVTTLSVAERGESHVLMSENGPSPDMSTPERIRTSDPRIRSPLLYPAELRAQDH
jgi:hypothetical protein